MHDSIAQFQAAIQQAGIKPPAEIKADGKLHRFATNDEPHDDAGWYVLHNGNIPAGAWGDWRSGISEKWRGDIGRPLTTLEDAEYRKTIQICQEAAEQARIDRHEKAARKAHEVWKNAHPAKLDHPYLLRKQVSPVETLREMSCESLTTIIGYSPKANGEPLVGRILIVPIKIQQQLSSLEMIDEVGRKAALAGGARRAGYWATQRLPDHNGADWTLCIGEGVATTLATTEATRYTSIAALSCHNLEPVAQAMRTRYPAAMLIILADLGNGQKQAEQAAQVVSGCLALPTFKDHDGSDFNDMAVLYGLEAVKDAIANAIPKKSSVRDWPQPRPIAAELKPVMPFDANVLLPSVLREWVTDEANRMLSPPDFIASVVLTALGSVIGARCGIKPKALDDWLIVPNLWCGIVAPPSTKKTPAISAALQPLEHLSKLAAKEHKKQLQATEVDRIIRDAEKTTLQARIKKIATVGDKKAELSALSQELHALQDDSSAEPKLRRFKTNDTTVEKLGELLSENLNGLLVVRDELVGLLVSWDRSGHEGDRTFYLEGWNGSDSFDTDRIGRGSIHIPNLCLSLCGGIQPDKLIGYLEMASHSLENDGLLQRFQMLVYPDPLKWEYRDQAPNAAARAKVFALFESLVALDPLTVGANPANEFSRFPSFRFNDEAQAIFIEWTTALHQKMEMEEHSIIQQHLAKYEKLFPTLALIFHLSECVTSGYKGPVTEESALCAAAWCEYLETHARRCYGLLLDDGLRAAQALSIAIQQSKLQSGFTARIVRRNQWKYLTTESAVQAALEWLEDEHWLRSYEVGGTGQGSGRKTRCYEINPQIHQLDGGAHDE